MQVVRLNREEPIVRLQEQDVSQSELADPAVLLRDTGLSAVWSFIYKTLVIAELEALRRQHLPIAFIVDDNLIGNKVAAKALLRWAAAEREAWLEAVTNDPLLPGRILPSDYLGQPAWRRRVEVLRDASRQLRTFKPE